MVHDRFGHDGTESNEVGIPGDRPGPGVGDDEPPDPLRAAAGEIEPDGATPIDEKEGDVFKAELVDEAVKIPRMGTGMVVLCHWALVVSRLRKPGRRPPYSGGWGLRW